MDFERIVKKWKIEVTRWVERGRIAGWVDSRGFVEEVWTRFDIRKGKSSTSDAQRSRVIRRLVRFIPTYGVLLFFCWANSLCCMKDAPVS